MRVQRTDASSAPVLYICASAQDRMFVEALGQRLRPRGLEPLEGSELGVPTLIDERQRLINGCTLVLVVVSQASMRSSVVAADYRYALEQGMPIVPLIVESAHDLPADLGRIQGADFSRVFDDGWSALLLALDTFGTARFPIAQPPELDAEVVVARIRAGRAPLTWSVSRMLSSGARQLSGPTLVGAAITIPLTIVALLATRGSPGSLLFPPLGAYVLALLYLRFSPRIQRLEKGDRARMVIITPEGVVVRTGSGWVSASFHEASMETGASEPPAPLDPAKVMLQVRTRTGRKPLAVPLEKLLGQGMLAEQALSAYTAYRARYAGGAAQTAVLAPPPPVVFLSYAHKDASFAERLELSLQESGYHTWLDRSDLRGGDEWSPQVQQAIVACAALVVLISPAAMRSREVRREYTAALEAGKPVIGALVRTTWRLPAALRGRVQSDHRAALLFGQFDLCIALDDAGVHPGVPNFLYARMRGSLLTMARALQGQAPPAGQVYRGRLPRQLFVSVAALTLTALFFVALSLAGDSPYFFWLIAVGLAGFAPGLVWLFQRRLRYPDIIVALPDGYITFLNSARVQEYPYASLQSLIAGEPSRSRGIPLLNVSKRSNKALQLWIPPTFRERVQIAAQIQADFAHFQQRRASDSMRQSGA